MGWFPIDDGFGVVGYGWECPKCGEVTSFTDRDDQGYVECEHCEHREKVPDPETST